MIFFQGLVIGWPVLLVFFLVQKVNLFFGEISEQLQISIHTSWKVNGNSDGARVLNAKILKQFMKLLTHNSPDV